MLQREFMDLIDENSSEKHPSLSSEQLSKNNQYFLYDQELLDKHFTSLPPIEAYLYFPKRDEQVIVNPKNKWNSPVYKGLNCGIISPNARAKVLSGFAAGKRIKGK